MYRSTEMRKLAGASNYRSNSQIQSMSDVGSTTFFLFSCLFERDNYIRNREEKVLMKILTS